MKASRGSTRNCSAMMLNSLSRSSIESAPRCAAAASWLTTRAGSLNSCRVSSRAALTASVRAWLIRVRVTDNVRIAALTPIAKAVSSTSPTIAVSSVGRSRTRKGGGISARGERRVVGGRQAGTLARVTVEGRLQRAVEMAPDRVLERCGGVEAAPLAQALEPARADRDMADLVRVEPVAGSPRSPRRRRVPAGAIIAGVTSSPRASSTSGTTASRASRSPRGRARRLPQPVMRRQVAVCAAERVQPRVEQREMLGLVGGDADPVVEERARQCLPLRTAR